MDLRPYLRRYYHGTDAAQTVLESGFKLDGPRRKDPGDFGSGIYLSPYLYLARVHGQVLKVRAEVSRFAYLPNPYFLKNGSSTQPESEVEKLFYSLAFRGREMITCSGNVYWEERERAALAIRVAFLAQGYPGIRTGHRGETVVFDPAVIGSVVATWKVNEK